MSNYEIAYNEIIGRINAVKNKEAVYLFLIEFSKVIIITLSFILVVSVIELLANGDETFRLALASFVMIGFFLSSAIFLSPVISRSLGLKKKVTNDEIALRIGNYFPFIKDKLCNALQLIKNISKNTNTSTELSFAAFSDISEATRNLDFDVIIDKNVVKKHLFLLFAASILFTLAVIIFNSTLGSAMNRIINWNESYLPPAPFTLSVEPSFKQVIRGEKVEIKVIAKGQAPETVNLKIKELQQENFDEYKLKKSTGGIFSYEISSLRQSIIYYAESNWLNSVVTSNNGKITVTDKPFIRSLTGKIIFPSYTKLSPQSINENNADITAVRGSKVELQIIANKDLKAGEVIFRKNIEQFDSSKQKKNFTIDTLVYKLKADGQKLIGYFPVTASGKYYIRIYDKLDVTNSDPIEYNIISLIDAFPSINLIEPIADVQVSDDALLPMRIGISDDYGFSKLKLHYRLFESRYAEPEGKYSSLDIPILSSELSLEIPYLWDLNTLGISPEDKYEFYLEVFDNDIISGPKSSRTKTLTVRLPSLEEVLRTTEEIQKDITKELEKVLKDANDVSKEIDNLNREMLKKQNKKELDWKDKKKAEDISKKQEEIQKKLDNINKNLQQMTEQLQQNNVLSQETIQKFLELQKLMNEVNSPELERMQRRMEEALRNISQEELQKTMREMKFNEEAFRASIERTMKILKRLQAEQKIDALSKLSEKLRENQENLNKEMENANPNDKQKQSDFAKKQNELQKDLENINKELQKLGELMKEIGDDMPIADLKQAEEELNYNETMQEMQNAEQDAQSGNFNKAGKSQKKAGQNIQKFSQRMQKMKQDMQDKSTKEAIKKLQKAISDILNLSKKQESLKDKTQMSDYNSTQLGDYAENQAMTFEALANVANGLMALAEKSFAVTPEMGAHIGDALEKMQQATKQLSERRTGNAVKSQQGAMSSMNQAISAMQDMLSQLQGQGSGQCENPGGSGMGQGAQGTQGFSQRLQQLAAQQQGINQAMQQLMQGGGKLSPQQQSEMGRIANKQGGAGKSLQELANEQKSLGGEERKTLGDLDRIAKEMTEVATDIQQGNITPETLKRQERILSRLLDATRSIHDRDFEKQREARSGKDITRKSPGAIDLNTKDKSKAFEDMLRSLQQGYTKDYEALIRKYFEALGKEAINN